MIPAIAAGVAALVILGLIALTSSPSLNTETPRQPMPGAERRTFPAELTDAERAAWEQLVAALEADHA